MQLKHLLTAVLLFITGASFAQTVIVTDDATYTTGQASAALDVKSISKGFLAPRLTQAQRTAIASPAEGLLVYQTDGTKGFYYFTNSAWTILTSGSAGGAAWSLTGNSGTASATNFLGTTDFVSLRFRSNNTERMVLDSLGNTGIGTTTPAQKLDVKGTIVSSATTYPNYAYNSANRMAFGESNVPANETGSVVQYGSGSNTRNMLFAFTKTNVNTSYLGNDGTQMMLGSEATNPITFRTGLVYSSTNVMASGSEVMRLTSTGRLGIGTTAPATALHVVGTNPLTLYGVQNGLFTDSLLTISAGTVRKLPIAASVTNSSWSLTGNAGTSYATNFLGSTDNNSLRFRTNNTQGMMLDSLGNVGIGTAPAFTTGTFQEKLLVDAGTTSSFNAFVAKGSINNYFQMNIRNGSNGANASSDVVATADNGDESINYVDLGINSSANTQQIFGAANDAYLYTTGNNLLIGTGTAAKALVFLTGGTTQSTNERMRIDGTGAVAIGKTAAAYKVDVKGRGSFDSTLNAPSYTSTFQTLTFGSTITWDQTKGATAAITLTANATLSITNAVAGMYGLVRVTQDATGSRTLTLPSGSKVINGGTGAVALTTTANATDVLSYFYDGTNYYWTIGYNYN